MSSSPTSEQLQQRTIAMVALEQAKANTNASPLRLEAVAYDLREHGKASALLISARNRLAETFPEVADDPENILKLTHRLSLLDQVNAISNKITELTRDGSGFEVSIDFGYLEIIPSRLADEIVSAHRDVLHILAPGNENRLLALVDALTTTAEAVADSANKIRPHYRLPITATRRCANDDQKHGWFLTQLTVSSQFAAIKASIGKTINYEWQADFIFLDSHRREINDAVHKLSRAKILGTMLREGVESWKPFTDSTDGKEALAKLGLDDQQKPEVKIASLIEKARGTDYIPPYGLLV